MSRNEEWQKLASAIQVEATAISSGDVSEIANFLASMSATFCVTNEVKTSNFMDLFNQHRSNFEEHVRKHHAN